MLPSSGGSFIHFKGFAMNRSLLMLALLAALGLSACDMPAAEPSR